jgi:nucleoside-diphosphate-sugar epimerase
MVIGKGMVAKRFEAYERDDQFLIFASGVSNSKNINQAAYERELTLLQKAIKENPEKILVYFSTCSIYDPEEEHSKYVLHKKQIEHLIQTDHEKFYVFRVSNLVGHSANRNTILNFYVYHILNGINFDLWTHATRNLIDIDDMYRIVDHLLKKGAGQNDIINIANEESYGTGQIITAIENFLDTRANYIPIAKGNAFTIDTSATKNVIKELGILFETNYLTSLLRKYYNQS